VGHKHPNFITCSVARKILGTTGMIYRCSLRNVGVVARYKLKRTVCNTTKIDRLTIEATKNGYVLHLTA